MATQLLRRTLLISTHRYHTLQHPGISLRTAYNVSKCTPWLAAQPKRYSSSIHGYDPGPNAIRHMTDPANYDREFAESLKNPEEYWAKAAEELDWHTKWNKVLDDSKSPFNSWFVGGELNTCYNCLDRHVLAGHGRVPAIIYDSPVTETVRKITYSELLDEVSRFASVLVRHGVGLGDRVLIYMPMIPQAVVTMLACARIGAMHSLVFGGFASKELATRISHAEPKIIVSANGGIEPGRVIDYKPLLDAAIDFSSHKPDKCIIYNRVYQDKFKRVDLVKGRDLDYEDEMSTAKPHDAVPVPSNHPLYLLYTSGTTGTPKGVVRPTGGHAVVLNWAWKNIYGIKPFETWFAASDLGWIVGHSYIVYAPLLNCITTVLFEGKPVGTPDASTYYRMLHEHEVAAMFVAPTAMRALRREDPHGEFAENYTFPHFRYMYVAGEHCDHETMEWIRERFDVPVLDNWWQTETGSAITSTCVGLGNDLYPPAGVAGKPVPGWDVKVIRKDGTECEDDELGNIVSKLPLPPACFTTLWKSDQVFEDVYFKKFKGYYDTTDSGYRDKDGNIAIMGRTDDVINVAGHRLSTGQLEEAVLEHDDIAEAAIVGLPDDTKGHVPLALMVLKSDAHPDPAKLNTEVRALVREFVGPVASFKDAVLVKKLPKTRSGKIARNTIAAMVAGKPYKIPVTIEDASVYPDIQRALANAGYKSSPPSE